MRTVFLVIPHYVFTSDLLRTKYIEYLSSKFKVVVISPMLGEREAREGKYFSSNVSYVKWGLQAPKLWKHLKFFRISLVGEFDNLSAMQYFYKRPNFLLHKKRRLARFLGRPFSRILTANFFTRLESILLGRSKKFNNLLAEHSPSLVITCTPGLKPIEAEMIMLAKKAKIPTVAVNFTWDNLTTACKFVRETDYLVAWNNISRGEAIDIHGYSPERVYVAGVPRFDHYFTSDEEEKTRERFLQDKGLDISLKTIVFASKPKLYIEQLDHLREIIRARDEGEMAEQVNILVRPHPLDEPNYYKEFLTVKNLHVDQPAKRTSFDNATPDKMEMDSEDLMNLKYTLKYCDVHVQYGSTLALEAAVFDGPVVNIGFLRTMAHDKAYKTTHFWPIIESGASPLAKTPEEMIGQINEYLKKPFLHKDGRAKLVEDYIPLRDSMAYKRNVDFLTKIN